MTPRLYQRVEDQAALNRREAKSGEYKAYSLAHPKYGLDIEIRVDRRDGYIYHDLRPYKAYALD
jgi:hypothetical protein